MSDLNKINQSHHILEDFNKYPFLDMVKQFEVLTNQKLPLDAIENFAFTGLTNEDFLFSNYLFGFKCDNLNSYILKKEKLEYDEINRQFK